MQPAVTREAIRISEAPVELGVGSRNWSGSTSLEMNSHREEVSVGGGFAGGAGSKTSCGDKTGA